MKWLYKLLWWWNDCISCYADEMFVLSCYGDESWNVCILVGMLIKCLYFSCYGDEMATSLKALAENDGKVFTY